MFLCFTSSDNDFFYILVTYGVYSSFLTQLDRHCQNDIYRLLGLLGDLLNEVHMNYFSRSKLNCRNEAKDVIQYARGKQILPN